jgi:uncharacterized protein
MTTLALGYGLGLYGRVGHATAIALALLLYLAQVALSAAYLRRFRFGPVEWLWRRSPTGAPGTSLSPPSGERLPQAVASPWP